MKALIFIGTILKYCILIGAVEDSYVEAYQQLHNSDNVANEKSDYNDNLYPYPAAPIPPQQPNYQYGPPRPVYGPPPVPNYPPPLPAPVYGPPAYQKPHGMLGLLDKLKWKIDLYTLGKILLKIVLFKKLISFIAIICLLLFIPTLKHKHHHHHSSNHQTNNHNNNNNNHQDDDQAANDDYDDDYDDGRKLIKRQLGGTILDNLTHSVVEAIEKFNKVQRDDEADSCESIFCKIKRTILALAGEDV